MGDWVGTRKVILIHAERVICIIIYCYGISLWVECSITSIKGIGDGTLVALVPSLWYGIEGNPRIDSI